MVEKVYIWFSKLTLDQWALIIIIMFALSLPEGIANYKRQKRLDKYFAEKRKRGLRG